MIELNRNIKIYIAAFLLLGSPFSGHPCDCSEWLSPGVMAGLAMQGGSNEGGVLTAEWTELPTLPQTICNNAVAAVRNSNGTLTLYSFMGIENPSINSSATANSYKITLPGGAWESIADAPLLNARAKIAANAATVNGEVYLVGGYTIIGPEMTEPRLFRYDPVADSYIQLADVPVEVDDTVVGVFEDRYLFLVSGWHGPFNDNVNNVQIYDTVNDSWLQATPIPGPAPGLFGHAGGMFGNRLLYMDGADSAGFFNINDRFFVGELDPDGIGDLSAIDWQELAAHPGEPTYRGAPSPGLALDDGWLLVGGTNNPYNVNGIGYNGVPSSPLDQVLYFTPDNQQWQIVQTSGKHLPTMDHRGIVGCDGTWITIGGMIAPGQATDKVYQLQFGAPAETCYYLVGDVNRDGMVSLLDVSPFVDLLATMDFQSEADANFDGVLDLLDIAPFVSILVGS